MKSTSFLSEMSTVNSDPNNSGGGQAPTFGRDKDVLETTSGVIASVPAGNGSMLRRGKGSMFQGIKTSSKFANSRKAGISKTEEEMLDEILGFQISRTPQQKPKTSNTSLSQIRQQVQTDPNMQGNPENQTLFHGPEEYQKYIKKNKLQNKLVAAEGRPEDLPGIDYDRPGDTPRKQSSREHNPYPFSREDDDDYFREIFRKKREAKAKEQGVAEGEDADRYYDKQEPGWRDTPDEWADKQEVEQGVAEEWSQKYKSSINCSHPKGFSQKAHCAGKKKHNESVESHVMEMVCEDCGMCQTHGNLNEIKKGAKDSNGFTKCWPGKHAEGTKQGKNGPVRNCVPNESIEEDSEPEGDTLKNSLHTIIRVAQHLDKRLDVNDDFPEWISEKIGATKGMMVGVMNYLISDQEMDNDLDAMGDNHENMEEGENWSKYNNKRAGGMSKKSVNSYRRSHPGSKIQTAVTTKPSKLKKGSKSAKRRASFCARMRGMKKHRTGAKTARDPNSNINKSLRRWHCESIEELQQLVMIAEQKVNEAKNSKQQAAIAIAKQNKKSGVKEGNVEKTSTGLKHHGDFPDYPREKGVEFQKDPNRLNKSMTGRLDKAFDVHWEKGSNREITGNQADISEEVLRDKLQRELLDFFEKGRPKDLSNKPKDKEIQKKEKK